jgi:hypothetical protein
MDMLHFDDCDVRKRLENEVILLGGVQVDLDVWTLDIQTTCSFVHYTFSPLNHVSYAEFGDVYFS